MRLTASNLKPPVRAAAPPPAPVATPAPTPAPRAPEPASNAPTPTTSSTRWLAFSLSPGIGTPWPLFRHHLRSILRAKKTPFLLAGLLVPLLIGFFINSDQGYDNYDGDSQWGGIPAGTSGGLKWFQDSAYHIYFPLILPLVVAAFASGAINEEVEGKTLPYLFTRPVYRNWILLAKALAIFLGVWVLAAVAMTISWVGTTGATEGWFENMGQFMGYLWLLALTIFACTGLFVFLGVLWRRSLILICVYIFIWEFFMSQFVPVGFFQRGSLLYYERAVMLGVTGRSPGFIELRIGSLSSTAGAFVLLFIGILGLMAALYTVSNKDYNV